MTRGDLLFFRKDLPALIRGYESAIREEVAGWERNRILGSSESDLVSYLVEKYTFDAPRTLRDQLHIENEGETKIDVSGRFEYDVGDRGRPFHVAGSFVTVAIPFEGDGDLFDFKASTYSLNPPRGRVSGSSVLISFQGVELDAQRTREQIDTTVGKIEQHLENISNDCAGWNARVSSVAEQCVRDRKESLLKQANMVRALGLPMKRRPESAVVSAVPVTRKKRPVVLPPAPREAFRPEPALSDSEYDYILGVIDHMSRNIERSPSTFVQMKEEQIRDIILVNLNGHYEGSATGETFNAQGKTDILIRANDRNVFVAECKFWAGPNVSAGGDRSDSRVPDLEGHEGVASRILQERGLYEDLVPHLDGRPGAFELQAGAEKEQRYACSVLIQTEERYRQGTVSRCAGFFHPELSEGTGSGFQGESLGAPVQRFTHGWLTLVCRGGSARADSQHPVRDIGKFAPVAAERDQA